MIEIHAVLDATLNRMVYVKSKKQPTVYVWNEGLKLLTKNEFDKWVKKQRLARLKKHGKLHTNTDKKVRRVETISTARTSN